MYLIFFNIEFFLAISILVFILLLVFLEATSVKFVLKRHTIDLFVVCKHFVLFCLVSSLLLLLNNFYLVYFFYGYSYLANSFINFFKFLLLSSAAFIILSLQSQKIQAARTWFPYGIHEFFLLVLFNVLGLCFFLSAENFLLIYLGLELHSLTLAILFSLRYFSKYSTEAALKYFIVGSFTTSLFLFGVGFLYGLFGTIHLESLSYLCYFGLSDFLSTDEYLLNSICFALGLIIVAFLIKLGIAPFHMWTLDVYEGAPMLVTLYALVVPKIAYIGFLVKLFFYFSSFGFIFFDFFKYGGILSLMLGTVGAMVQTKIKRILAYSAISNFGYILLSLSFGNFDGVLACLLFLVVYVCVTCNIFFILILLISYKDNLEIKSIFQLRGLINSGQSYLAFLFALLLFTLASIPPSNIFIAKYLLLYSIIEEFSTISVMILLFIVLSNIFSCFYYIRMIRLIFFKEINLFLYSVPYVRLSFFSCLILSVFSLFNLFLFLYPQALFDFLELILVFDEVNFLDGTYNK